MSKDEEAVLLTVTGIKKNRNGFPEEQQERTEVFVGRKSTSRTEAYKAMQEGHTVAVTLAIDTTEYESAFKEVNGAICEPKYAEYNGKTYRIMRTYGEDTDEMELVLEENPNGGV